MEQTLEFIEQQISETLEGLEVLHKLLGTADTMDQMISVAKALSREHGKLEAYYNIRKQIEK